MLVLFELRFARSRIFSNIFLKISCNITFRLQELQKNVYYVEKYIVQSIAYPFSLIKFKVIIMKVSLLLDDILGMRCISLLNILHIL